MKIIDADKLHYKQVYIQTEKGLRPALVVFAKEIRKMPDIVRCKGCKHSSFGITLGKIYCDFGFGEYQLNDFCSQGERREDGKTD